MVNFGAADLEGAAFLFRLPAHAAEQVGNEAAGWFSAQPLFDVILAEQPDLLE